jgi:hypothetical protein
MRTKVRDQLITILIFATLLSLCGCATNNYLVPIGDFQKSVNGASTSLGTYYRELNNFEREVYLDERLYDKELAVFTKEKGKPTPVVGQFSEESIQARVDALTLLGIYGNRLAELAGSKAPECFAKGAKVLGENLSNLGSRFEKLKVDTTAFKYATPISTIVGLVGQRFLEAKRKDAINEAVAQGAPAVNTVLDLLEDDLNNRIMLLEKTGTKQMLENRVSYYNENRKNLKPEERRQALNQIKLAAERYQLIKSSNPAGLVQAVREAHVKLVDYANSDQKPTDLAQFVSAMEVFKNRVIEIANAIQQMKKIREETR